MMKTVKSQEVERWKSEVGRKKNLHESHREALRATEKKYEI